jgi:uncharacterized heparinase superfamily protein
MYHSLILEDVLDLINLTCAFPNSIEAGYRTNWTECAGRMLRWLELMSHPDGRISFFNDAAFSIAAGIAEIREYAESLSIVATEGGLGESGYIRLANENTVVLFDAAPVGPYYQPGHAHADTLSFELSHKGARVLVNSGTSTYESGSLRRQQRSTDAHNTASVDNRDSSEVWSSFRVARRAEPFDVSSDQVTFAEASHSGFHRLPDSVTHRRRLELEASQLRVIDTFEGTGKHHVRVTFHCHPDAKPNVVLDPRLIASLADSDWFPEFNTSTPNRTVSGSWTGECPVTFVTHIPLQ